MRLQHGVAIAGMDPALARSIVRVCHDISGWLETVCHKLDMPAESVRPLMDALTDAGFLETRMIGGEVEWTTTLSGGGLANASFLKPISRQRAEELLATVVARAETYNEDAEKPMYVDQIRVFGSYLLSVDSLGDVDIALTVSRRPWFEGQMAPLDYARKSGRRFGNIVEELTWAEREMRLILKARNPYVSLHTEDITRFTNDYRCVYARSEDSSRAHHL